MNLNLHSTLFILQSSAVWSVYTDSALMDSVSVSTCGEVSCVTTGYVTGAAHYMVNVITAPVNVPQAGMANTALWVS